MSPNSQDIASIIKRQIEEFGGDFTMVDIGTVVESGDGVVRIHGLSGVKVNELLQFQNDGLDDNPPLGQLNSTCITNPDGQCINNLLTSHEDIGTAVIQGCVTYENLEELVVLSGGTLNFPELNN